MNLSSENKYLVCPSCYKVNPVGRKFCEYCGGYSLDSQKPVSAEEAERISEQHRADLRRRKRLIRIVSGSVSGLILVGLVLLVLYNASAFPFRPSVISNSSSSPGEWSMFRHDLSNSGVATPGAVPPQGKVQWIFTTGAEIDSSPVVSGNTVYVGSRDGKLYALDATTGAKRWEYQTGSWIESTPAVVGGSVYFGSNDGFLYALDAATGTKRWAVKTQYAIMSSPAVADGIVYVGTDDNSVIAVDAKKGTKIWEFGTSGMVKSSPVVANGLVYVGSGTDYAYILNARTGKATLNFKTYYPVGSSPLVVDRTVFFITSSGTLFAVDDSARNWPLEHELRPIWMQIWAYNLAPAPPLESGLLWGIALGKSGSRITSLSSSPALAGDGMYVGVASNLVSIDLKSRKEQWSFSTQGVVSSSPAISNNTVYVGSEDGHLYAVNAFTGEEFWDFPTGAAITASPAVANGTVYIGSHDFNLYAIK